jgi:isopentenyl diphosphate isomerase/L-lactate dehydrogenase-like FMN-dependent dehydrogenase
MTHKRGHKTRGRKIRGRKTRRGAGEVIGQRALNAKEAIAAKAAVLADPFGATSISVYKPGEEAKKAEAAKKVYISRRIAEGAMPLTAQIEWKQLMKEDTGAFSVGGRRSKKSTTRRR